MNSLQWKELGAAGSGLGETAAPNSAEQVLHDPNLLYCIATHLKSRKRLVFSSLSRACNSSVLASVFWETICGSIIETEDLANKESFSYSQAVQCGNRLGYVLRKYGRFCARLNLSNCLWLQVTGLEDLARCSNLVHLDMSGCRHYSVDLLGYLTRHCPSLRSLVARDCVRICEPAIIQELFDLPERFQLNLEHLDLRGVSFAQDAARRRDVHLPESDSDDDDLTRVLRRLVGSRLISLRLGCTAAQRRASEGASSDDVVNTRVDLAKVMKVVQKSSTTLRLLDIAGGFQSSVAPPYDRFDYLRVLSLINCHFPGSMSLVALLEQFGTAHLEHLNLSGTSVLEDSMLVPSVLRTHPRRLRSLNVSGCTRLTDRTLRAVATYGCADELLTSLNVCDTQWMTPSGLRTACSSLPNLTELGFNGTKVTDADVADLAAHLPGLRVLAISGGHSAITDVALGALATCCTTLEVLKAAEGALRLVTRKGLQELLEGCKLLREVDILPNFYYCDYCHSRSGRVLSLADLEVQRVMHPYRHHRHHRVDIDTRLPDAVVRAENEFLSEDV